MSAKKTALGKGLGALISDINEINKTDQLGEYEKHLLKVKGKEHSINPTSICEIPIEKITPNALQPRTRFDEEALDSLAESIRTLGLIQPITVRPVGEKFQVISGERRYRAAVRAGVETLPAYIRETDSQGMLEMAIVENIQREDLDAIEIALSYSRLLEECHFTQDQMAERIGKKRSSIANYLRLLKLPVFIQAQLRDNKISMGHAKVLLSLEDPILQEKLCLDIIQKDLSVRQLESMISSREEKGKASTKKKPELPSSFSKVIEIIGPYFDNHISIKRDENGKGKLILRFKNDQEVERFLEMLENKND